MLACRLEQRLLGFPAFCPLYHNRWRRHLDNARSEPFRRLSGIFFFSFFLFCFLLQTETAARSLLHICPRLLHPS